FDRVGWPISDVVGGPIVEPSDRIQVVMIGHRERQRPRRASRYKRWLTARMLPSVSLNQAVLAPPAVAMLFFITMPGMLYSSKVTPRPFNSATSASTSATCQNAWLALDVPALGVGYMKTSEP